MSKRASEQASKPTSGQAPGPCGRVVLPETRDGRTWRYAIATRSITYLKEER